MRVILLPRNKGKTTALVEMVKNDPDGVLVCLNRDAARRVVDRSGLAREKVIGIVDLVEHCRGRRVNVYIDNLDAIIGRGLLGCECCVKAVSLNEEGSDDAR